MAKKDSLNLFRLIHSLTAHEKAYFVRYAKQHASEHTEYMKLYHILQKMQQYDEQALKKKFRNLSILKNYLFNLLLDVLSGYYNNPNHPQVYLFSRYIHAYILEKKGFTKMAASALQQGINTAAPQGNIIFQYLSALFLHRLQSILIPPAERGEYFNDAYNKLNMLLQKEQQTLRYIFEFDKVKLFCASLQEGLNFNVTEEDINLELLLRPEFESDIRDNRMRFDTLLLYYQYTGKEQEAYQISHEYLRYEEAILNQPGNNMEYYSRALMHTVIGSANANKVTEAEKYLEVMKRLQPENREVKRLNDLRYATCRLNFLAERKRYAEGAKFAKEAMKDYPWLFETDKAEFQHFNTFAYTLLVFFFNRDFDLCIHFLNHTDMVNVRNNAPDLYKSMEILRLMLQLEMGNYDLLESLMRNTQHKLKKHKMLDGFTKTLLQFFKYYGKKRVKAAEKEAVIAALTKISLQKPLPKFAYNFMKIMPYIDYVKSKC